MEDHLSPKGLCLLCRAEFTSISAEVFPGKVVHVCEKCLESSKENFIWICINCGSVYKRLKSVVLKRLSNPNLRRAYLQCRHLQIIQGVDRCLECGPDAITEAAKSGVAGHC